MHQNINHIVQISTDVGTDCEYCSEPVGIEHFTSGVNHYIEAHDYKLLHVGQQTVQAPDGALWHHTVAVLGKSDVADTDEERVFPDDSDENTEKLRHL